MTFLLHILGICAYFILYTLLTASLFGIITGIVVIFASDFLTGMSLFLASTLGASLTYHTIDILFEKVI